MTDLRLPDALLDMFASLNVADKTQGVILLLSAVLGLLLVLIILIAARGRTRPEVPSAADARTDSQAADEPAAGVPEPAASLQAGSDAELVEEFRIFKKPKTTPARPARPGLDAPSAEQLSTTEHLRLIEKNMIRLRDLYQGGHITRDMYIDETRSLYHQARGLSSVS